MSNEIRHDPMPIVDVLEKVRQGCEMHMNQLDNDGHCGESDEYVVALAFFDDHIEKIKSEEEKEAMREAKWNEPCPYETRLGDHIEERERDAMLAQQEIDIRNDHAHESWIPWSKNKKKLDNSQDSV